MNDDAAGPLASESMQRDAGDGGTLPSAPQPRFHAHFDCFSGAAGDMMLAACLDAANYDATGQQDQDKGAQEMMKRIAHCLRQGLPELADEFELECHRVWRGMGSITALHVKVNSVHQHAAAPVPAPRAVLAADAADTSAGESTAVTVNVDAPHNHAHDHEHSHSHSHSHDDKSNQNDGDSHSHGQGHQHSHSHSHGDDDDELKSKIRNLPQIRRMLEDAPEECIPLWVRDRAIATFTQLAQAEAAVHGASGVDAVHFHEVGAVDSIVDTVGTLLALHFLGAETVSCSRLPLGEGTVKTDHGLLPVPAPATLQLMIGMPTAPGPPGWTGELVTPTGAALLRTLTMDNKNNNCTTAGKSKVHGGRPPGFTLRKTGVGAGTKDFKQHPNVIRLLLGDDVLL